jgi:tetratricopeptide (TPR) repeat protein
MKLRRVALISSTACKLGLLSLCMTQMTHIALAQAPAPRSVQPGIMPGSAAKSAVAPDVALPVTPDVVYQMMLGEGMMQAQQFEDAYVLFSEAAKGSKNPQVYKRAAEAAWRAGLGEQALAATRQWADLSPEDGEAARVVAQVYATLNRPRDAVPYLKRELSRAPESDKAGLILGLQRLLLSANDKQAAFDATRDWLQSEGNRPEAQIAISRAAFAANRSTEAWAALAAASKAKPDMPSAAMLAIENLERAPEQGIAIASAYARSAKTLDGPTVELLRKLAGSGRIPQALLLTDELTKRHPQQAEAWLLLGNLHDQANQPDMAEKAYLKAVQVSQVSQVSQGAMPKPVDIADEAAPQRPSTADAALIALAATAERKKDYSRAENFISQISRAELQHDSRVRLVASALRAKDMRTAWALVNALPEATAPQKAMKLGLTGQVLRSENKFDASFNAYERAVAESPNDADLIYEASFAAEKVKQWDRMETLLKQVMDIKPNFAHAYNSLGYTLADRGVRLQEAEALIQKALALSQDDPFIIDSLGWAYYRMGRKADALRELQRAYGVRPDAEIAAHLGEVLWEMGRKDDAVRTWKDALAAHESGTKKPAATEPGEADVDREGSTDTLKETLRKYQVSF